ncbi:hypothetical protein EE612_002861, partial [Oryza sativa]
PAPSHPAFSSVIRGRPKKVPIPEKRRASRRCPRH